MKRAVALVSMPFANIDWPSLALGILKRCLRRRKIPVDVFYLNMRLRRLMDSDLYDSISDRVFTGDWIFSQHLFGKHGTREIQNSRSDLKKARKTHKKIFSACSGCSKVIESLVPRFMRECLQTIPWQNYGIVGFTSVFSQQLASLLLAKRLKESFPDLKIVFGGANVQGSMGIAAMKAFNWIDFVVDGEAEDVFPELIERIFRSETPNGLPGVSFRNHLGIQTPSGTVPSCQFGKSPIPDFTDYFDQLQSAGLRQIDPTISFESSRGCWWGEKVHCTFCGLNGQLMTYRKKSPRRVVREILTQAKKYRTVNFKAVDNILMEDAFRFVFPMLREKDVDLNIFYEVKSNLLPQQIEMLSAAGVRQIQPGIESLNTDILKLMRKGVTGIQNLQLLKWCRHKGIHASWNLLYGFPGESKSSYEQIRSIIPMITHLQPPSKVARIVMQRFSPYHSFPEQFGITALQPDFRYSYIYPKDRVDLPEIAFYFEHTFDYNGNNPDNYIRPVKRAVNRWNALFESGDIHLYWKRGPGFVEILDTRPFSGRKPARRWIVLTELEAEIYSFCDTIQSFSEIVRLVQERTENREGELKAQEILNGLKRKKILFSEKQLYLSLALPDRNS